MLNFLLLVYQTRTRQTVKTIHIRVSRSRYLQWKSHPRKKDGYGKNENSSEQWYVVTYDRVATLQKFKYWVT